jgi:DNA-binding transcriptional regulator YiaG
MELNNQRPYHIHLRVLPKVEETKPLTRNQRFKAALARNHSKIKQEGKGSTEKKCKKRQERRLSIQQDADRLELLNWIREIQDKLDYTCKEFARIIGVSEKTVVNWRGKAGYMPTLQNFRKLLELEKLTRHSVTIIKNRNSIIRRKNTIKLVFI